MKIKQIISTVIFITASIFTITAEELSHDTILSSALQQDETMQILLNELEIQFLQNGIKDHKNGFALSVGTDETGTAISNIGKTGGLQLCLNPFAEFFLPETMGTSIKASVPVKYNFEKKATETSVSFLLNQDISKLFGIEKQNDAKAVRRSSIDIELRNRIITRRAAVEKEVIETIRSLAALEKSIVAITTSFDEKESLLINMLNAGILARNGSSHLSKLMELRSLEIETGEFTIEYKTKLERFYRLTGIMISETPQLPQIITPQLPVSAGFIDIAAAKTDIALKEAELSDFNAFTPPRLTFNIGVNQEIKAEKKPVLTAGFSSIFEDFTLSVNGKWNNTEGGTITAGVSLSLNDKTKKELNRQIFERNLETSELNLQIVREGNSEALRNLQTEITKLKSTEKNLNASKAFITKCLDEMQAKFQAGLIPEIELIKAQDQKKSIDIDMKILNIDRYLLSNSIRSLIQQ